MESCLFCNQIEKGHPVTVDYVCGHCTQKLINIDAIAGKKLFDKAEAKNNRRQMQAITLIKGIK